MDIYCRHKVTFFILLWIPTSLRYNTQRVSKLVLSSSDGEKKLATFHLPFFLLLVIVPRKLSFLPTFTLMCSSSMKLRLQRYSKWLSKKTVMGELLLILWFGCGDAKQWLRLSLAWVHTINWLCGLKWTEGHRYSSPYNSVDHTRQVVAVVNLATVYFSHTVHV